VLISKIKLLQLDWNFSIKKKERKEKEYEESSSRLLPNHNVRQ